MTKPKGYIVMFGDQQGASWPYASDNDVSGALCYDPARIAFFLTRAHARQAIRISTAAARLQKEQGEVFNEDFLRPGLKNIKIVPLFL